MFMSEPAREAMPQPASNLSLGLALAVIGVIVLGVIPTPVIDMVQRSVLALGGQ